VIFPLANQEVAGIRTKEKSSGLKLYAPYLYAGQHEVDFEPAKRVLRYFATKGYDIGESGALSLYACAQFLNFGVGTKFVVILADGVSKYSKTLENVLEQQRFEVPFEEAASNVAEYRGVLWTHGMFSPTEKGKNLIASSLGVEEEKIQIVTPRDVNILLSTGDVTKELAAALPNNDSRPLLVVCMVGGTSLQVAKALGTKGIKAESLVGGITGLSKGSGKEVSELVRVAF
jgi:cysteine synthase